MLRFASFSFRRRRRVVGPHAMLRPRKPSKKEHKGIVICVNSKYGRILCERTITDPGIVVYFNRDTIVNGTPLHLLNSDISQVIPSGTIVDFKVHYDFPSQTSWLAPQRYATAMGYLVSVIKFDSNKLAQVMYQDLVVMNRRSDDVTLANNGPGRYDTYIHPTVCLSPKTENRLISGEEIEVRMNFIYSQLTQRGRTLQSVICPTPRFLRKKIPTPYTCLSFQPLSTTSTIYARLVAVGVKTVRFDTVGDVIGSCRSLNSYPIEVVMDRDLFDVFVCKKKNESENIINANRLIGEVFQVGIVVNVSSDKCRYRGFCAYYVAPHRMPTTPTVRLPRMKTASHCVSPDSDVSI